jgi:hypothetical protein
MLWKVPCWIAFTVRPHMRKYVAAKPLFSETLAAESLLWSYGGETGPRLMRVL